MRNLFLLISFFTITPCVIIVSIIFFAFYSYSLNQKQQFLTLSTKFTANSSITYAALPSAETEVTGIVGTGDTRVARVKSFFHLYGSVLEQYAQNIIDAADHYNIDYRYLPAIAAQESQLCKTEIPNTNNCWGWGIYHGHTTSFQDYPTAIETISKLFAQNYIKKGYITPEQIQQFYNPTNNNGWSSKVNYFMNQISTIL